MTVLKIIRFPTTSEGTFGVMFYQDKDGQWIPFILTLERKWMNNEKGKSCIPPKPGDSASEYMVKRVNSPKFGDTFEVMCGQGRDSILFHAGNLDDDSHGCIILGSSFDLIFDKTWNGFSPGVSSSRTAMNTFLGKLKNQNEFKLVIEWAK